MFTFLLILLAWAWVPPATIAQDATAIQLFRAGEEAMLQGDLSKAESQFKGALRRDPTFKAARRLLGSTYELQQMHKLASMSYDSVLTLDSMFSRLLYYQAGMAHYRSGSFRRGLLLLERFKELQDRPYEDFGLMGEREREQELEALRNLDMRIQSCRLSLDSTRLSQLGEVVHLGKGINTYDDEYFPFLTNDRNTLYFTRRKMPANNEDLYVSRLLPSGWQQGKQVSGNLNTGQNEGMATFIRNGKRLFFTACGREGAIGHCEIWEGVQRKGKFQALGPMDGDINGEGWQSQAAVSCDGSELYFSSIREGGQGGADIWICRKQPNGEWGAPENLGPPVNTAGDEEAPFITNDGQSLFFSSDGHHTMGESDILMSWREPDGEWTSPMNLGPPVNSANHEIGFFLSADNKTGLFASDRPGGEGGMDLYKIELPEALHSEPITFVEGKVFDAETGEPVRTTVFFKNRPPTDTDEDGLFFICVPAGETVDARVLEDEYDIFQAFYEIPEHNNEQFYPIEIALVKPGPKEEVPDTAAAKPPPVVEKPNRTRIEYRYILFFGFDSSKLDYDQREKLKNYLMERPEGEIVKLDIIGYADDIGEDAYNLDLSEQRAREVGAFLKSNSLVVDNVYIKGMGAIRNNEPNYKNRRVEVQMWIER